LSSETFAKLNINSDDAILSSTKIMNIQTVASSNGNWLSALRNDKSKEEI